MKINALLDVNVVAHETEDEVAVLLELEAPAALADATRPQASLQVVLDRSGLDARGAARGRQEGARRAGPPPRADRQLRAGHLRRLRPGRRARRSAHRQGGRDRPDPGRARRWLDRPLGRLPPRPARDPARIPTAGGKRGSGTVLVISDGHVNAGIKDVDEFASVTSKAYADSIVTSTLGYGRGYDETLLAAIARSGSGNHVFADNPDAAGAAIAGEVDGLLNKVVQALSLTVKFEPAVEFLRLYNDLPAQQIGDGQVMIELGDLYSEEARKVLLKLKVPALSQLGLARVATLELAYVELPGPGRAGRLPAHHRQRGARRRGRRPGGPPDRAVRGPLPGGAGRQAPGVRGVRARHVRRGPATDRRDQGAAGALPRGRAGEPQARDPGRARRGVPHGAARRRRAARRAPR